MDDRPLPYFGATPLGWAWMREVAIEDGRVWDRDAALTDLRWWADQVRQGRRKRLPGRPTLARDWGWSSWAVRALLQSAWRDPRDYQSCSDDTENLAASLPPVCRQSAASPDEGQGGQSSDNRQSAASPPPVRRQSSRDRGFRARPPTTHYPPPPGVSSETLSNTGCPTDAHQEQPDARPLRARGAHADHQRRAAPIDSRGAGQEGAESGASPIGSDHQRGSAADHQQDPTGGAVRGGSSDAGWPPLPALWAQLQAVRASHQPGARGQALSTARRAGLKLRCQELHRAEFTPADLVAAAEWVHTSDNFRAQGARKTGDPLTVLLRAAHCLAYVELAEAEASGVGLSGRNGHRPAFRRAEAGIHYESEELINDKGQREVVRFSRHCTRDSELWEIRHRFCVAEREVIIGG